jgi:hypothetical protein
MSDNGASLLFGHCLSFRILTKPPEDEGKPKLQMSILYLKSVVSEGGRQYCNIDGEEE